MLQTLGIVEVGPRAVVGRLKSGRGPGGRSLLEWTVRRVTDSMRLNAVIVLAPRSSDTEVLRRIVPPDVPVHLSPARDELGRLVDALSEFPAEGFVRVSCDHPLVDPVLVDRLVIEATAHPKTDYLGYCLRDGLPAVLSSLGVFGEWIRTKALIRADRDLAHGNNEVAKDWVGAAYQALPLFGRSLAHRREEYVPIATAQREVRSWSRTQRSNPDFCEA